MTSSPEILLVLIPLPLLIFGGIGAATGWYALRRRYPDTGEPALLELSSQSGIMRGVGINNALRIEVCASGLRVGLVRPFSLFCRDFLVPWPEMQILRKEVLGRRMAELRFGRPKIGNLTVDSNLASRLARAAGSRWPELQLPADVTPSQIASSLLQQWLLTTCLIGAFFVGQQLFLPAAPRLPLHIILPLVAVGVGVACLLQFVVRTRR